MKTKAANKHKACKATRENTLNQSWLTKGVRGKTSSVSLGRGAELENKEADTVASKRMKVQSKKEQVNK
jgi:hypothetical protein